MKRLFPILLLCALFAGCAAVPLLPLASPFLSGQQPQVATTTSVQLATKNYKIVKTNVVGTSSGFSLLGFISLMSPDYAEAMAQLYQAGGITEGKAQAIVNVMQQNSSTYFILFGIPRITVRADVVEFTEPLPGVLELSDPTTVIREHKRGTKYAALHTPCICPSFNV